MIKRSVKISLVAFTVLVLLTVGCIAFLLFAEEKTLRTVEIWGNGEGNVMDGFTVEAEYEVYNTIFSEVSTKKQDIMLGKRVQSVTFSEGMVSATEIFDSRRNGTLKAYASDSKDISYFENTEKEWIFSVDRENEYQYKIEIPIKEISVKALFEVPEEKEILLLGVKERDVVLFFYSTEKETMRDTKLWDNCGELRAWGCSIDGDQVTLRLDNEEKSRLIVFSVKSPEKKLYDYEISEGDVIQRYQAINGVSAHGTVCYDADVYVTGDRVYIVELGKYFTEHSLSYSIYVGECGKTLYCGEVRLEDKGVSEKALLNPEHELKVKHGRIWIIPKQ